MQRSEEEKKTDTKIPKRYLLAIEFIPVFALLACHCGLEIFLQVIPDDSQKLLVSEKPILKHGSIYWSTKHILERLVNIGVSKGEDLRDREAESNPSLEVLMLEFVGQCGEREPRPQRSNDLLPQLLALQSLLWWRLEKLARFLIQQMRFPWNLCWYNVASGECEVTKRSWARYLYGIRMA
jgi:hypothetical protein